VLALRRNGVLPWCGTASHQIKVPCATGPAGSRIFIGIRAEDIILCRERPQGLSVRNYIEGKVVEISKVGGKGLVYVEVGKRLAVKVTAEAIVELGLEVGQTVTCLIKTHSIRIGRSGVGPLAGRVRGGGLCFVRAIEKYLAVPDSGEERSMKIAENCVVSIHYLLTDDEGEELDSSAEGDPWYICTGPTTSSPAWRAPWRAGGGRPAQCDRAAGGRIRPVDPELVRPCRAALSRGSTNWSRGCSSDEGPEGHVQVVTVQEVKGQEVTIDANHPWPVRCCICGHRGGVRAATAEELDHGHVHDGHGHGH